MKVFSKKDTRFILADVWQQGKRRFLSIPHLILYLMILAVIASGLIVARASTPLSLIGYLDFSYGTTATGEPTAEKPESKLWWNDGFWWGSMYNDAAGGYHIYRLNWGTQDWEDTGVVLDDRSNSRADIMWDDTNDKLYVASHVFSLISSKVNQSVNWGRLYRYSYDPDTQSYSLDNGFPINLNRDKTETLVLEKDSSGRLWATYVSRDPSVIPDDPQVFVNFTTNPADDTSWDYQNPLSLATLFPSAHVSNDDIASIISFDGKIGVLWSNQLDGKYYFATHEGTDPAIGWNTEDLSTVMATYYSNDHINFAKDSSGDIFAAIKTNGGGVPSTAVVGLLSRDASSGTFSFLRLSEFDTVDTRPIALVNESENKIYVFTTSVPYGGRICYRVADIVHPLSGMTFTPNNCRNSGPIVGTDAPAFIADEEYDNFNNATSTKQIVNDTTGLVVMASDDINGQVYAHNVMGNPPPVVTSRSPDFNEQNVSLGAKVLATFSKEMDEATLNSDSFYVENSAEQITGTVLYDNASRTVSFTPSIYLSAGTTYTATLTSDVEDNSSLPLYGAPEQWSFTTGLPAVQFEQEFYNVMENGGSATITVTLNMPSSHTVTVDYATSDGTATEPGDYTSTSGTLTFNPGETLKTFDIPIIDNGTAAGNKTVNITLDNPDNADLGTPATARLTIIDDEKAFVLFDPTSISAIEASGTATITVKLTTPSEQIVSVDYDSSDGTAHAPDDYTAVSGTLSFDPGQTSKTFQVAINNDSLYETNETVNLTLSNPVNTELGTPDDKAILTILDDDPIPSVQFSSATYSVNESTPTALITVTLSSPSGQKATVNYATSNDTALAGKDYTATSGTLTFNPSESSKTFTVPILDDALNEPQKSINLTLSSPDNAVLGVPATANIQIIDDDPMPVVQFSQAEYSAMESSDIATITVTLNAPSGQSISIDYATSNGTAEAGKDYVAKSDTLTFDPGDTVRTIEIDLKTDNIMEGNETLNITLSNPDEVTLGTPSTAKLTIIDDDKAYVKFDPTAYSVSEASGTATITVKLTVPVTQTVMVDYASSDGTAHAPADYTAVNGTLSFVAGDTSETFQVPINNDTVYEVNETVNLALSDPVIAELGTPDDTATLTILDNDSIPSVQFSAASYSVSESTPTALITVTLSSPSSQIATVNYATSNDTAVAGDDYTATSGTLTFNPDETIKTIQIPILSDALYEPTESLTVTLSSPVNAILGVPAAAMLQIIDDDSILIYLPLIIR